MAATYHLTCHGCKETIWVGQGSSQDQFYLYNDGMIEKFLWRHRDCDLKFQDDNDLDGIEMIKFGHKIKGELLGFPVYTEFTHPSQIKEKED